MLDLRRREFITLLDLRPFDPHRTERRCAGKTTELRQVDAILCEDFLAVHVWFYFRDGGDALIGVDLSTAIDPAS
jgi:hypothetical protein